MAKYASLVSADATAEELLHSVHYAENKEVEEPKANQTLMR